MLSRRDTMATTTNTASNIAAFEWSLSCLAEAQCWHVNDRRTPAIDWDEFVVGDRAGLIAWNTSRLEPKPGEPGWRAPAEVLREHGYRP